MEWTEIKSMANSLHEVQKAMRQREASALSDTEAERMMRQMREVCLILRALEKERPETENRKKKERLSHLLQEAQERQDQLSDQLAGCLDWERLLAAVLKWD